MRAALDSLRTDEEAADAAAAAAAAAEAATATRRATRERATKETQVSVSLALDGAGEGQSATGITTLDAFLDAVRERSRVSAHVRAAGDLWIDDHHTAEDVSLSIGQCLAEALGDKAGLNRMGSATATRGDSTVEVVMDLSNRPSMVSDLDFDADNIGDLSAEMVEHVFMSLTTTAGITMHVATHKEGSSDEDRLLAAADALGECLRQCTDIDPRRAGKVASSKGTLSA